MDNYYMDDRYMDGYYMDDMDDYYMDDDYMDDDPCMPRDPLESMYPRSYFIIYPAVCYHCDLCMQKYGLMYNMSQSELDGYVDMIYRSVQPQLMQTQEMSSDRILRDSISTMFISELIRRRRRRRRRRMRRRRF